MAVPAGRAAALIAFMVLATVACDGGSAVEARPAPAAAPASPAVLFEATAMNGCDPHSASPPSGDDVTIAFGGAAGDRYRPRCITVNRGDAVRFIGDFALHPLTGGVVVDGEPRRDPMSPLPYVHAGGEATFRADRAGAYPYYCEVHWILGMSGVVYVR